MTDSSDNFSDDMSAYLQAYLDETDEELETLVQCLLTLEEDPRDGDSLNEAFRMLHSLKGSSGMMGYEGIADLAHSLETQFDQFRGGQSQLDRIAMDLALDCVDFFRDFVTKLRAGEATNQDGSALIERLAALGQQDSTEDTLADVMPGQSSSGPGLVTMGGGYRVRVSFQKGLQLADLKARLIIARLSNVGEIVGSDPPIDEVDSFEDLPQFVVILATDKSPSEIEQIASVDGVEAVEIGAPAAKTSTADTIDLLDEGFASRRERNEEAADDGERTVDLTDDDNVSRNTAPGDSQLETEAGNDADGIDVSGPDETATENTAEPVSYAESPSLLSRESQTSVAPSAPVPTVTEVASRPRVAETVRVEIDRLDRLMNLTGELVVTNARFNQISGELGPVFRRSRGRGRMTDLAERLQIAVESLLEDRSSSGGSGVQSKIAAELRQDLVSLQEQSAVWDDGRRHFSQIAEAVDQLSRVSQNLQQGVLDTRMMPVGPLFGRFKRVIRDLSQERNKQVELIIRGQKTELDKRMIDELGDPLLHLIRNSIDHGLEMAAERTAAGKPQTGTVYLEASHSGNNVFVTIRDDGAGINIEKVRSRIIDRGLMDQNHAAALSDQQVIDHIWHPGFSTAEQVSDISGRGVGMDIVKSRIADLNGSVEVTTEPGCGTTFLLRLPLTLAIIRSLMIRFRDGFFSIPIDDVREIVSIPTNQIYSVHGKQTIEVRGEFIPLARMDQVFTWHGTDDTESSLDADPDGGRESEKVNVVILESRERTLGLCVDELLGGADIVIKSLADNFLSIRGLSGASIMGDGTVCLMLDTTTIVEMA